MVGQPRLYHAVGASYIVKLAATNRLTDAANQMWRVILSRKTLFRTVAVISAVIELFLMMWTILDTPGKEAEYMLSSDVLDDGATVVTVRYCCSWESDAWTTCGWWWSTLTSTAMRLALSVLPIA